MEITKVPFFGKDRYFDTYSNDLMRLMKKVYSHGKVVMGPEIEEFENKLANYCSRKYAIAVGSCTDALYFSLLGIGIKEGDEVLVTSFSFIASASCILRTRAVPVFIDINPETYMMDLNDLEKKITNKTKAILAVDIFGDALDINALEEIGEKYNLPIIEDAAQSIGSRFGNRKVGSLGLCSCISFDPTKILSAQSNGGIVLTDDYSFYEKINQMRYHGKNLKTGEFETLGFNSRLASLQAAILSYNLDKLESWIEIHRNIANKYKKGLSDIPQITLPKENQETRHVYHKFVIKAENRDELKQWLSENNIQVMIHYDKALHENKLFENYDFRAEGLNEVNKIKTQVLSLPIHPFLKDDEINFVIQKIKEFYNNFE